MRRTRLEAGLVRARCFGPARQLRNRRKPHAAALIRIAVQMGRVMMPRSTLNALLVQSAFRLLGLYGPRAIT
jgi:hypothetical protein